MKVQLLLLTLVLTPFAYLPAQTTIYASKNFEKAGVTEYLSTSALANYELVNYE
ncbi:hypothetical protein [Microscilla marina]|uniref:Uncharacterized protein n=1 Tax=Microscilla marina ATCC 23134 TaxID=313606 RepID=A1ZSZ9_MICM2|nr:hypothetical protein [Microscilla marina]EAY26563.1 hypothetical protein M23134_01733 [Microscilla marina ATCC 23134]